MRWAASASASAESDGGGAIARSLRLTAVAVLGLCGAAIAQPPAIQPPAIQPPAIQPPTTRPPATLSLSDAEKAALLSENSEAGVAAARSGLGTGAGRQIHGMVGAAIGSHGARSTFGAAAIPLGEHAGATVSFESSRWGGPR